MNIHSLLQSLARAERQLTAQPFFAPAIGRGEVAVRIGGIVCRLRAQPAKTRGWCVFQTDDFRNAFFVRQATLAERDRYLSLFPATRLIVSSHAGVHWNAVAAGHDSRFRIEGEVPVQLAEEIQLFDTVICRFDGVRFWHDRSDPQSDPATASYLRSSFAKRLMPSDLRRGGLTSQQRAVYELNMLRRDEPQSHQSPRHQPPQNASPTAVPRLPPTGLADRLQESLSHAGAELVDYTERNDGCRVTFSVDGHRYTSSVDKASLSMQVAGICLSGEDAKFDLESLVGVVRRGGGAGDLLHVGDEGMDIDEYWSVHPPTH